jgi:L-histidine N-alpha-methyltransferase
MAEARRIALAADSSPARIELEVRLPEDPAEAMARDVGLGLSMDPKELAPKYFYDERGSRLFEQITELEEYYPTRIERQILADSSPALIAAAGDPSTLVELGSGSAAKTGQLLDAMRDASCLRTYVPVDISEEITRESAERLCREYQGLEVKGLVCDFERDLERIPAAAGPRTIAFLGGTIGNFYPDARREFLSRIAALLGPTDRLLLGTDLVKERRRLEAAYNDARGVTAEFNKNVLRVLNRELGADFDLDRFEHVARYDDRRSRMDIRLRSLDDQQVRLARLDMDVNFAAGEEMRTEISAKFTRHRLTQVYASAGLRMTHWFTDPAHDYALSLARAA